MFRRLAANAFSFMQCLAALLQSHFLQPASELSWSQTKTRQVQRMCNHDLFPAPFSRTPSFEGAQGKLNSSNLCNSSAAHILMATLNLAPRKPRLPSLEHPLPWCSGIDGNPKHTVHISSAHLPEAAPRPPGLRAALFLPPPAHSFMTREHCMHTSGSSAPTPEYLE